MEVLNVEFCSLQKCGIYLFGSDETEQNRSLWTTISQLDNLHWHQRSIIVFVVVVTADLYITMSVCWSVKVWGSNKFIGV